MLDAGATETGTLLEVNNIEVIYNHVILVLKGVSLGVREGGITALLGGNGAGKTTTLKAISNLLRSERGEITKGRVLYRGEDVGALSPADLVRRGVIQVMEGRLQVDIEGRTFDLGPRQGVMVPKGVVHRTRAKERTVVLMVEAATIVPTGDGAAPTGTATPARPGRKGPGARRARGTGTRRAAPAARGRARRGAARGA